jgi:hypothetical protein
MLEPVGTPATEGPGKLLPLRGETAAETRLLDEWMWSFNPLSQFPVAVARRRRISGNEIVDL